MPAAPGTPSIQRGTDTIVMTLAKGICGPGPVRAQCPTSASGRRQLTVHPREARRPAHPGHQGLPGPIRAARRCRRYHPPGRRRHRHAAEVRVTVALVGGAVAADVLQPELAAGEVLALLVGYGNEPELLGASLVERFGKDVGAAGGGGTQEVAGVVQARS